MKKISVDLNLGRKSKSYYKRLYPKGLVIKMNISAPITTKSLITKYAQLGLPVDRFIEEFNKRVTYQSDVRVVLLLSPTKSFEFEILIRNSWQMFPLKNPQAILKLTHKLFEIAQTTTPLSLLGTHSSYQFFDPLRLLKRKFNFKKKKK